MFVYVLMSCSVYVLMLLRSYVLMFWCSYVILFLVGSETDVESEWARSETEADSKWNRGQFQWTASGPNIISGPSWTLCGVYWAPWAPPPRPKVQRPAAWEINPSLWPAQSPTRNPKPAHRSIPVGVTAWDQSPKLPVFVLWAGVEASQPSQPVKASHKMGGGWNMNSEF